MDRRPLLCLTSRGKRYIITAPGSSGCRRFSFWRSVLAGQPEVILTEFVQQCPPVAGRGDKLHNNYHVRNLSNPEYDSRMAAQLKHWKRRRRKRGEEEDKEDIKEEDEER
ncbi:unnamed protein product [Pleuronectes platessa]|uniref:Uncharacterized protein n=1 Tax=Pleuronectes platessa TaxID=8262 RepID=A0A9N7VS35_PLEPL|nr:unnamed protein product [Pleuronectes platessa]